MHLPVATTRTPVGYTGEQTNPVAGLQHYHARDYQPGLASWIQADTWAGIRTLGQTLNKYAYVLNNPATLVDVLGNRPCAYEYNNGCHDTPLVSAVNDNCSPMNGCAVDNGWTSGPGSGEPIEYGPQDGDPSYGPTPATNPSNPSSDSGQYNGNPICNPRFVTSGTCQITGISLDPNSWLLGLGIAVGVVAAAGIVACVLATTGFCAGVGVVAGTAAADGTAAAGEAAAIDAGAGATAVVAEPTVADLNALVPSGQTLGSWGNQIWGTGTSGDTELIGARTASELSQIPGLTVESATTLRNFYRLAVEAGKGGATVPVRVELLNNIIKVLGGTP
ncbi:RHS repeat-associated core domain-containing protein [Microbacterium azadirachtae]|uniref:RHS repeat-associated core domain-containing protein n=1 Tax=Microbacterium azadirachtae TaxID=582680 RepID=A0A1I6HHD8_9MICO|nr:RHS repeat-associated core domain-containing protein [Microbacterium azadirachtae]SFR53886.1 RHS repeat-associated core domain-containing protein [Microbacterium azadirachtae]